MPQHSRTYIIEAALGTCETKDSIRVTVLPYPHIRVSADTLICHGDRIRLQAAGGVFYKWSPAATLSDSTAPAPLASPAATTTYTVTVTDTTGCPKPALASVRVRVMPPVHAFAGHDTIAVLGKPFRLHATGGNAYVWSPATGLSDPYIADPVVTGHRDMIYKVRVASQPEACFAYDTVEVRFLKGPALDVPTAFTPNGDGRNDILRPIAAGIAQLDYFQVYDRWGRMVYRTRTLMQGWNGSCGSGPAPAGAYVWMASGKDDRGKPVSSEGSVLLIR
jgi:gliding motility-associated-like protein